MKKINCSISLNLFLLAILLGLSTLTCESRKLKESLKTTPKIDECKGVPAFAKGEKGAFTGFDVVNCYDWTIMSSEHYRLISK